MSMAEQWEYVVVGLGALGSATAYQLARRGERVLGLERFELGHTRGASHDSSRILRHSYHTPGYVAMTFAAYDDWADLEEDSGEDLVTTTGGLDLFPPGGAIPMTDYTTSMAACGVPFDELSRTDVQERWPQLSLPDGTVAVFQKRSAIVPAARGVRVLQSRAAAYGAQLRDQSPVQSVQDRGARGIEVVAGGQTYRCRRLVVCADAWANEVLAGLELQLPLTATLEQVTYFRPPDPAPFAVGSLPLWIWMDDPCFYGFPCYGEATVKAAQDCGGPLIDPAVRARGLGTEPDAEMQRLLSEHMAETLPGSGPAQRSVRCIYTLTPDRDFVLGLVPDHESASVGLGAAHGFKFAPTLGRLLADLAMRGDSDMDLTTFRLDRPGLTDSDYVPSWLV
jgi:sarcosine oxidase